MVQGKATNTGSNVARVNKVRADHLPLRMTVKNQLGRRKRVILAEWNVRTLMDRATSNRPERQTALVAKELSRYKVDIAALNETRFAGYDSLVDCGYTFFWSGKSEEERRESGVGFAIRNPITKLLEEDPSPVSDRIMTMRLPLEKDVYATIVCIYAPTMTNPEETKEEFYSQLREALSKVPRKDKLILTGDFNARVGREHDKWDGVIGPHGTGKCNSNGELLLALCSEYGLIVTNTVFRHKEHQKVTWMHPRSKHWHLLDYVITRKKDLNDVLDTRVMRGADCATDHQMVRSKLAFSIRRSHQRTKAKPPSRLDLGQTKSDKFKEKLESEMNKALGQCRDLENKDAATQWKTLRAVVYETAEKVCERPKRKHQDWFDETDQHLAELLESQNSARINMLQTNTRSKKSKYTTAKRRLQQYTRKLKSDWWEAKAESLQLAADKNDMKSFYRGLREVYGPARRGTTQLTALDGSTVLQERSEILNRFADHFDQLLNIPGLVDDSALDTIIQRPEIMDLSDPPDLKEVFDAIDATQEGRSPGICGIPAEIWKYSGTELVAKLHQLILKVWSEEDVPQDWRDASIVPIFKKGSRMDCGNYRGISLLSIAGKILSRILLNRLNTYIAPAVLPESQCGFRSGRGTMDMIFCLRQTQEKCIEQNMPLYAVFIDFTKAFDTVSRDGLWRVLAKFGCPAKFINIIRSFHDGMKALVAQGENHSKEFDVSNGVKQGCVLAPTLFSLYLSAMLEVAFEDSSDGVFIQSRHDADLFNISHFKAKTKTCQKIVREMLFADDSALVAHDAETMQRLVDRFSKAAEQFSLKINIKKTECLFQPVKNLTAAQTPSDILVQNKNLVQTKNFVYLGSTISDSARIDSEITFRMGKASAAYAKLRERLWDNHHVSIRVKCRVYRAVVLSALLYGAETWTIYRSQVKKLHGYMMRHLRGILKISWKDKVTNEEIYRRTGLSPIADLLIERNLRWTGHIQRMGTERLPRQLLYSQLCLGVRNQGRPRLRFKDVVKRNLKWRDIKPDSWKSIAGDRPAWRARIQRP